MRKNRIGAALLAFCAAILVFSASASAATFSNPAPITIIDALNSCSTPSPSPANPYPSPITVSGLPTQTTDVNATISGFSHTFPADVRMLLVGPHGQSTDLFDEDGGGTGVSDLTLTFDDAAATTVPTPLVSGTFKPTQDSGGCGDGPNTDFPGPAPASPYGTDLGGFNGTDPNGTWSLYVVDDNSGDSGTISGGWNLDISTSSPPVTPTTPSKTEDPKCAKLRKKLKHQKRNLARATTDKKRSMIKTNIEDTKQRLKKLDC